MQSTLPPPPVQPLCVVSCAQERKLVVSLLDSDGDGEVSFREFFRWWKSHKDKFFGVKRIQYRPPLSTLFSPKVRERRATVRHIIVVAALSSD